MQHQLELVQQPHLEVPEVAKTVLCGILTERELAEPRKMCQLQPFRNPARSEGHREMLNDAYASIWMITG